jgi:hypothetical protein
MEKCLLLHARRYDFKDAESGRAVTGVTLTYLQTGGSTPQADQLGEAPLSVPAAIEVWNDLSVVPGFYAIDFRQRPGPRGRPTLQATGLRFLSGVELDTVDSAAVAANATHP